MGLFYYRCSRCRTRNSFKRAVESYIRQKSCRDCGYRKFYTDKERRDRPTCRCSGAYFWGPHRPGSRFCESHPRSEYDRGIRNGSHPAELAWEGVGLVKVDSVAPPF